MIPVVFTSMIHDSYKNFLPDSWFTKTFDDLFIKWISLRLLWLVLRSFFWCSNFCFHPELYRFLDYCFSVSLSFVLVRYGVFQLLLNIKHQRRCRNKRTISPGCTNPAFPWSNAINSYVYFVALFSEARYSWFLSRSTKIHDSPLLKTKIHDSHKFCNYD